MYSSISVESIVDKHIAKGKTTSTFRGRLFYAIVPDKWTKSITFYYSRSNFSEDRSVVCDIPLFIKVYFKFNPASFWSSNALTKDLDGDWNDTSRKFLSSEENIEASCLDLMEDKANAEPEIFISTEQQRELAMDDDKISIDTRLTKGDAASPPA